MLLLTCSLLVSGVLAVSGDSRYDIPPTGDIASGLTDDMRGVLQRMEERQILLVARVETLTHTMDTQLAQLDNSILLLYKELGSSRLTETLDQLKETAARVPAAAAAAETGLAQAIGQQIEQSGRLLETQLNETHQRLESLLQDVRPFSASDSAVTTIVVERCSFQDNFQSVDPWRPADCAAVQQRHQRSGIYTIFPPVCGNGGGIRVFCDMDTDGGGWTVLMRRADVPDHQDFNMGWQSYKWGFGNLSGEFWLGNEYMSLLTSMDQMQLRVDLGAWDNTSATATYTPFSVGTEQQKYLLKIGKYEGKAGNSLGIYNGMKFSTKDQDNDRWSKNCAVVYQNAGWHNSCMHSTLTGPYHNGTIKTAWIGVTWHHWKGNKYSLKHVEMKTRPVNYMTWCHKLAKEGARE